MLGSRLTRSPPPITVILIDISASDYSLSVAENSWKEWTENSASPCCGATHGFVRHGTYSKFHYRHRLALLRVRCRGCGKTHALIPEFSLPGTCLGTAEVEQFVAERGAGASRMIAGRQLRARGIADEYLRRIERMIIAAIQQAKALFADLAPQVGGAYRWLAAATGGRLHPLVLLNRISIAAGCGAVFCSLAREAGRGPQSSGIKLSHNNASPDRRSAFLHSG